MDTQTDAEPEFSRRAAKVMQSPWWFTSRGEPSAEGYVEKSQKVRETRRKLTQALLAASRYEDLPADMRAVFDAAEQALTE